MTIWPFPDTKGLKELFYSIKLTSEFFLFLEVLADLASTTGFSADFCLAFSFWPLLDFPGSELFAGGFDDSELLAGLMVSLTAVWDWSEDLDGDLLDFGVFADLLGVAEALLSVVPAFVLGLTSDVLVSLLDSTASVLAVVVVSCDFFLFLPFLLGLSSCCSTGSYNV